MKKAVDRRLQAVARAGGSALFFWLQPTAYSLQPFFGSHLLSAHAAHVLLRADPELRVVILDWAMPGEDLRTTVARMREIRPEVRFVGTSGEDRSSEFRELGIEAFLLKPWTVAGDLAALLGGDT